MTTKIRKAQAGVPPSGNTGQILVKNSNTSFDYDWSTVSLGGSSIYANGDTTKNAADASGTQTIPHGLPAIPKKVRIEMVAQDLGSIGSTAIEFARAIYNGTTQSSQSFFRNTAGGAGVFGLDNTFTINTSNNNPAKTVGVITFDATNIYIAWTKTGTPTGTYQLLWDAVADNSSIIANSYTVNADELVGEWYTTQIQAPFAGGTNESFWSITATGAAQFANGAVVSGNGTPFALSNALGDMQLGAGSTNLTFANITEARLKFIAEPVNTGNPEFGFIGYAESTPVNGGDPAGTGVRRIGFTFDYGAGQILATTCNGSAVTTTLVDTFGGGSNEKFLFSIIQTSTTSVDFYVNGVLEATITTTIPTTNTVKLSVTGYDSGGAGAGFQFVSNFTYSQKLS